MTQDKTSSIGIGVAVYVVLSLATSFLYFNGGAAMSSLAGMLSCLVAIIAPIVAVWHYTSTHNATLAPGPGAGLGAITGAAGGVIGTVLAWGLQQAGVFPSTEEVMERTRDQMIEGGMSPEEVDGVIEMMGGLGQSLVTQIGFSLAMGLVVGAIAGAIAALIFKKGEPDLI